MKTLQTAILVPVLLFNAAAGFPVDRGAKYASWDDVNVVAHGLLQLGQGLKEHVDKTKAQMRDITSRLKAFNATMVALEGTQIEQDKVVKAEREEKEKMGAEVKEMMKQTKEFHSRMNALEEKVDEALLETTDVNRGDNLTMSFIQKIMAVQNRRIDQMVDKIRQQQDKLDKQSLHLLTLQKKVSHRGVRFLRRRHEETTLTENTASTDGQRGRKHSERSLQSSFQQR
ncbi:angiopoietin-related protein 4 [Syngnathus scovelli]|uniref:angiopoietin-related protein 4 n=1 Tax=Syngnathus scovelli TaxID=161590 RepID=UPI00211031E1|nr:angiopoietin-related protein 4 [Syngnathus scovelli]